MLKGQQIVKNRTEIIKILNQAAATELEAAYYYRYLSYYATGLQGRQVAEVLEIMAEGEWKHVGEFLERIFQLGGTPFKKVGEAEKNAFAKCPSPPKNPGDWKAMLKAALKMEAAAIDFYRGAMEKVHEDPVTLHLLREVLEDEIGDEDNLAALLG